MPVRHRMAVLAFVLVLGAGCERAHRFHAQPPPETKRDDLPGDKKPEPKIRPDYGWLEPFPRFDFPLRFVANRSEDHKESTEWQELKDYWNDFPKALAFCSTPIGLPPLEAAVVVVGQVQMDPPRVRIKVPRGLPDPTPYIPTSNPPTYGKWLLGKRLFFDKGLLRLSAAVTRSCADCHDPAQGFTVNVEKPTSGKRNVPSLLNSVYNRHQFWDGRATTLEEVLQRQLDDENLALKEPPDPESPGYLHVFPGLVGRVRNDHYYVVAFERVFGRDATADNVGKALATYLRTLLCGDSVYDQAEEAKLKRKGQALEPEDLEPALTPAALERLPTTLTAKEAAKEMARGYALFHGKARCHLCHPGPLFTDDGFHNIGVGESNRQIIAGKEPGRFAFVPHGLKDRQLIGAFKTPTLRNLQLTAPYMHDGSLASLGKVLAYFNDDIKVDLNKYLDPLLLRGPEQEWRLGLSPSELAALELFLRSLRGNDLPALLTDAKFGK